MFPFRWGQTPLTEAILFKHTKVASLIKRHEKALQLREQKEAEAGKAGGSGGGAGLKGLVSGGGDVLWRKLVERNLMKPEKEKPVYKVTELIQQLFFCF